MYHEIGIEHLSPTQISRILNGHAVRVKHGTGHKIHVSKEQHKKILTAHRKGSAVNLTMDPFQISHHQHLRGHGHSVHYGHGEGHSPMYGAQYSKAYSNTLGHGLKKRAGRRGRGDGFLDNLASKASSIIRSSPDYALQLARMASPYAQEAGKAFLPVAQELATEYGKKKLGVGRVHKKPKRGSALLPAGYGVHHSHRVPHHAHHFHKHGHGEGEGLLGDIGSFALPIATELGTSYAKKKLGVGRKGRAKKGHGVIGQTLGSLFGQMLPI
jgi:hypothetical protein